MLDEESGAWRGAGTPCPDRARWGGRQRGATVIRGACDIAAELRLRWFQDRGPMSSKLATRVRFPSPALLFPSGQSLAERSWEPPPRSFVTRSPLGSGTPERQPGSSANLRDHRLAAPGEDHHRQGRGTLNAEGPALQRRTGPSLAGRPISSVRCREAGGGRRSRRGSWRRCG